MKDGRNLIIAALLIVVLTMAVGYSAFATQLQINGRAEITGEWNIEITRIVPTSTIGNADPGTYSHTTTTATFDADLEKPGDKVVYTITVRNNGTIDAELNDVNFIEQADGSPAITYAWTSPGETLKAGTSTTFTVTVEYDPEYEEVPEVKVKTITGVVEYIQAQD